MCKAHSKVTHIKQQKYFHHIKGRGYNKNSVFYPRCLRWWKLCCCFICVTLVWALYFVIKQQLFYIYHVRGRNNTYTIAILVVLLTVSDITSVSQTTWKPLLVKAQTALKTKNKQNMVKKTIFQYSGSNYYTLQCGTIMTLISAGDCTLQCGMWLWNHDGEFTKWIHPAMWYVALGWHATAMKFAQTSAILEFYIWFRFWPYHRSRHAILHQSAQYYLNIPLSAEINYVMSIFKMAYLSHLGP